MPKHLCIDIGNTRLKAAIFQAETGALLDKYQADSPDNLAGLLDFVTANQPDAAILCSVTDKSHELEAAVAGQVKKFLKLNASTPLPIMNAYHSPATLGYDRIALAVGTQVHFPGGNVLVVSLGTCITYNFVTSNRAFRGGAISPGLNMRLQAMHHFTDKLPQTSVEGGELILLGYDTETCLRSGAVFGMAAEIEGMVDNYRGQYQDFNAVLTGGDAPYFERKLKSGIFADPDLLFKGLNLILKYNAPYLR